MPLIETRTSSVTPEADKERSFLGRTHVDLALPEEDLRKLIADPVECPVLMPALRQRLKLAGIVCCGITSMIHTLAFSYNSTYFMQFAKDVLRMSKLQVSFSYLTFTVAMMISAPVFGLVASRQPHKLHLKLLLVSSLAAQALMIFLFAFLQLFRTPPTATAAICIFFRALEGMAAGLGQTAVFSIISLLFPKYAGTAFGIVSVTIGVGLLAGPTIGAYVFYFFQGVNAPFDVSFFMVSALFSLLITITTLVLWKKMYFIPLPLRNVTLSKVRRTMSQNVYSVLTTRGVLQNLSLAAASLGVLAFLNASLPDQLTHILPGATPFIIGNLFLIAAVIFLVICPLAGYLQDKVGYRATMSMGMVCILVSLIFLAPAVNNLSQFFNQTDSRIMYSSGSVFLSLALLGTGVALTLTPAIPEVLAGAKRTHIGNGAIELVGGMLSSSLGAGLFIGIVTGDIVVTNLNFKWAAGIQAMEFALILLWFILEVGVHFFLNRNTDIKGESKEIEKERKQMAHDLVDQMHSWANSVVEKSRTESVVNAADLPSSKNFDDGTRLKMLGKQGLVFEELIETEKSYVSYLKAFVSLYLIPLKQVATKKENSSRFLLTDSGETVPIDFEEVSQLCSQVQTFLNLHSVFLKQMSELDALERSTKILPIFKKYSDFFRMYGQYVANYDDRIALLAKMKKSKKFQRFLTTVEKKIKEKEGERSEKSRMSQSQNGLTLMDEKTEGLSKGESMMDTSGAIVGPQMTLKTAAEEQEVSITEDEGKLNFNQTIESYLIMPIQRIPRYLLLIREVLRNTTDDQSYMEWSIVYDRVDHVCREINKGNESREQAMKMLKIQDKIHGMSFSLVAPHRKWIKDVKCTRIGASAKHMDRFRVKMYLFNDILIWTNRANRYKGHLQLAGTRILSLLPGDILPPERADDVGLFVGDSVKSQRGFHLLEKKSLIPVTLIFDSPAQKDEWEAILASAIDFANHTIVAVMQKQNSNLNAIEEEKS